MPEAFPAAARRTTADRRLIVRRAIAVVVSASTALLASAPSSAATGSTNTLKQRAAAIAAKISADDAELNTLGEEYLSARAAIARFSAAASVTRRRVLRIENAVKSDHETATAAATAAYVDSGAATSIGFYLASRPDTISFGQVYLGFVESRLNSAMARLRHDAGMLSSALSLETREQANATAALAEASTARAAVVSTLASEERLYKTVQGQIVELVAEQLAAARAAAARRAAALAAAKAAAAAAAPLSGPPSPTSALSTIPTGTLSQDFAAIRFCESDDNYADNTGNGYYGAYQFSLPTWDGLGETGLPSAASPSTQDSAAYTLYRRDGWSPWPACAAIIGL
ncbi:MAG TPA: transglycosylase family protein [Acidimicrobiales bacterium]|nr:transglycosylase family protein [Acidimicrobiales bacterium]